MKPEHLLRTQMLIGQEALNKLNSSRVAVFGIGGVGSFAAEGLIRSGVGSFLLVDDDVISPSNLNRQIHATTKTIGQSKVEAMKERMLSINPDAVIDTAEAFVLYDNINKLITEEIDYVVDSLDTVTAKLAIAMRAGQLHIPVTAAMGTGNKLDPTRFEVADIYDTSICPLCRVMRRELKKRGIPGLKVVYSREEPRKPAIPEDQEHSAHPKRMTPGSISFVPSVAGLIIAGEVIKDLAGEG